MLPLRKTLAWSLASLLVLTVACDHSLPTDVSSDHQGPEFKGGKPSGGETAGNNLSFPVIWAEGATKVLPGTPGMEPLLTGEWWYWYGTTGTDPDVVPLSCPPDPDADPSLHEVYCDDGVAGTVTGASPSPPSGFELVRAYLQKDQGNTWQASAVEALAPVNVDLIDWGDNLESVDWYTRSQVRTEVVLFESATEGDAEAYGFPLLEYGMRHTSGWGITEVHGVAASLSETPVAEVITDNSQATVYSPCARFTIQKLLVDRGDAELADLEWVPGAGWTESELAEEPLINDPIFNMAVHEASDGPGYYNAEINVKGRIIFGYTWNVRRLNDMTGGTAAGDYRLTFSFDEACGGYTLNTYFTDGITEIMVPLEEELLVAAAEEGEEPGGGGTSYLDFENNLTYMDISIHERGGGGGGGGGGGPPSGKRGGGNH